MDCNLVVLSGRLAATPEERSFDSGARFVRYLVTTRSASPRRRVDVVPVVFWDPPGEFLAPHTTAGCRVWVVASVRRRFWTSDDGRRSRLEVVAHHVEFAEPEPATEVS